MSVVHFTTVLTYDRNGQAPLGSYFVDYLYHGNTSLASYG